MGNGEQEKIVNRGQGPKRVESQLVTRSWVCELGEKYRIHTAGSHSQKLKGKGGVNERERITRGPSIGAGRLSKRGTGDATSA